jgi:hypothetical protein
LPIFGSATSTLELSSRPPILFFTPPTLLGRHGKSWCGGRMTVFYSVRRCGHFLAVRGGSAQQSDVGDRHLSGALNRNAVTMSD